MLRAYLLLLIMSSPRAWGCFYLARCDDKGGMVFPTRVGVFLRRYNYPVAV